LPRFDDVIKSPPEGISAKLDKARAYGRRLGVERNTQNAPPAEHLFINGAHFLVDEVSVDHTCQNMLLTLALGVPTTPARDYRHANAVFTATGISVHLPE
jgi:hypothetical protein